MYHLRKVDIRRYLRRTFVFALLNTLLYLSLNSIFIQKRENYLRSEIKEFTLAYNAIINLRQLLSKIVFDEILNKPEILEIVKRGNSKNKEISDKARQELLIALTPLYERLKKQNIRQLHFHFPNNRSFLRVHEPKKYGDDLTNIRYSVKMANSKLIPFHGFEEGRVKNGFRYVYPIFFSGKHLGSVEVSMNFVAVVKELTVLFQKDYYFILSRKTVDKKVWKSEQGIYHTSNLSDDFVSEKEANINDNDALQRLIKPRISAKLKAFMPFTITENDHHDSYIFVFLPVENVEGKKVAYLVSCSKDNTIAQYYLEFQISSLIGLAVIIAFMILVTQLKKSYEKIKQQSIIDPLTTIANRRQFSDTLSIAYRLAKRESHPLSILMCDIDNFKLLNDTYGHKIGDMCLKKVAQKIATSIRRPSDFCARYGGEEFVVILPNTPLEGAMHLSEIIRKNIEAMQIPNKKSLPFEIATLSIGVSTLMPGDLASSDTVVNQADTALYQAKESGRNQVCSFTEDVS